MATASALQFARTNRPRFLTELQEFVRFPSVSAQAEHSGDIRKCAQWLADSLKTIGMEHARVIPTKGQPVVYAQWMRAPGRPTLLIYGHYDVVPPEPLDAWKSPPFAAAIRDGRLLGRGACDDKGQLFCHVKALESYLRSERSLPVNAKCLFEAEEEISSPTLSGFVTRNRRALTADVAVMSDTRFLAPGRPTIVCGLRGKLILELEVQGPEAELHCGNYGGAVPNPLQALCDIIATFHDATGRIAVPGFYHRVRRWSDRERQYMAQTGPPDAQLLRDARSKQPWGERGYSLYERTTIRPALSINGIVGGYQGEGGKAVIPARAVAKLDFRLVPDQDPKDIDRLVRAHVSRVAPHSVRVNIRTLAGAQPALVDRNHPALQAAAVAYQKAFKSTPVFVRSGGTIPVTHTFQSVLGIPTVLMGFALPEDRIHAPNESFSLSQFNQGIETCIWFLAAIGARRSPQHVNGHLAREAAVYR